MHGSIWTQNDQSGRQRVLLNNRPHFLWMYRRDNPLGSLFTKFLSVLPTVHPACAQVIKPVNPQKVWSIAFIKTTWFTFWYQNCFLCYTVYLFIFFAAVASCQLVCFWKYCPRALSSSTIFFLYRFFWSVNYKIL